LLDWVGEKPEIRESLVKTGGKVGVKSGESLLLKWLENSIITGKHFARPCASRGIEIRRGDVEKH